MRSFKKVFALTVAACMALGMSVSASFVDVKDSGFDEAITTLKALNIMVGDAEGNTFRPGEAIKRSEFAKVAVNALGLESLAQSSMYKTRFPDVVENHWANGYINVAVAQGMVIGDTDGNYRPDDMITYNEAMTILVRMLGYEPAAEAKGGFPAGYMVVGSQNNINKNVQASANEAITRGNVAQMTMNSLTVKLMEQTGFGSDASHSVVDKTLLGDKLNVTKLNGTVTGTPYSTLDGSGVLNMNNIRIDDLTYRTDGDMGAEYLGYNVAAYVREDDRTGENKAILVLPETGKNAVKVVDSDNYVNYEGDKFEYWLNKDLDKNTTKANVAADPIIMHNGRLSGDAFENPDEGYTTLLDNDNDGVFDIIFATEYTNMVVDDISATTFAVSDKYGQDTIYLDPEDTNIRYSIRTADGESLAFEALKEWDVLSVAKSKDGGLINVIVSNDKVEGKVEEFNADGDRVTIDGEEHRISKNCATLIALDDRGVFYLDARGKIAAFDKDATLTKNYAYLSTAGMTAGMNPVSEYRLFTTNGESVVLQGTDKIRFNGVPAMSGTDVMDELGGEGSIEAQLVTYEVNANGKLYELNTASYDADAEYEYKRGEFAMNAVMTDAVYKSESRKLGSVRLDESTVVFDIPNGSTDPDDYAVKDYRTFTNDGKYNAYVYDMAENMTAGVVVVTNTQGKISSENAVAVVSSISKTVGQSGSEVEKLTAVENGETITLLTKETGVLVKGEAKKALKPGDVIQYSTNFAGEIDKINLLFDIEDKTNERVIQAGGDNELTVIYGRVDKRFTGSINVKIGEDGTIENYLTGSAQVYSVDSTKNPTQVKTASAADIQKYESGAGSRVLITIHKDAVKEIVIVK